MARPPTDIRPRILEAARARFCREGVDGASLRGIAKDAGTSIGMIYYYFPTKDDLFLAVVEEVYVDVVHDLEELLGRAESVHDSLIAITTRISAFDAEEQQVLRLVLGEALLDSDRFRGLIERFRRGHVALLLSRMLAGRASGEVTNEGDPMLLVFLALATIGPAQFLATRFRRVAPEAGLPAPEDTARALVDLLFRGIGHPPPSGVTGK